MRGLGYKFLWGIWDEFWHGKGPGAMIVMCVWAGACMIPGVENKTGNVEWRREDKTGHIAPQAKYWN